MLRNGRWQPMSEPINPDRQIFGAFHSGVGLAASFADEYAKHFNEAVGLIPCADGGTSIREWQPGDFLFDHALAQARLAIRSSDIIGILWHQGETDAKLQTADYTEKLRTVVHNFRRDLHLDNDVPFIAGDMASFYREDIRENIGIVDQALETLVKEEPSFGCVTTKDMMHRGDNLHFDTESLHKLGERYFKAYQQLI